MKTNFSSNEKESRGLTRVELLTLVATFALLGLLAVPAWSRPGPRPSRTQCLANLRQIALATIQYANEYGNRLPQNPGGNWPIDLPVPVANTMQPFGLTKEILYEPGLQNQNNEILWNFTQQYHVIGYANTFAGTGVLFPANENTSIDSQPVKIAAVWLPAVAPASRVLWADTTMTPAGQNATDPASRASYNYSDLAIGAPQHQRTSHLQAGMPAGGNLAMLDGHVEWRQFADMIPRSAAGINRPFWWW
jgi:prepilin-type processing-associated H-X9-DG protein